jgi:sugar lactone lactonase YvrE
MNIVLAPYAPSVFTYQRSSGVLDPIIVHSAGNQLVTPTNPAVPGEYLVVYGTGRGDLRVLPATDAPSPTSPPAAAKVTPTATIGGVNAPVAFAGLTPGGIGLAQFNVQVPNNLPSGSSLPLVINFNGSASSPVNVALKNSAASLTILTVAGNGTPGFGGDGGSPTSAALNNPTRVVADRTGNLYILDTENNRVRKAATDGTITTIAGNGAYGFGGDGGPATGASMEVRGNPTLFPGGIAVDTAGNVYFSDFYNNRVRKISPSGIITTVAGNGSAGFAGDGGLATSASLQLPQGVAIDTAGNLYIADTYNHRVRKIDASGIITTVAGNGGFLPLGDGGPATSAFLSVPTDVAVDAGGNLYIVDHSDSRIRKVDTAGVITTVAGNGSQRNVGDGGSATQASFYGPQGVALDATGNIYIADVGNNRVRIVSIDGTINTEAGTGTGGFAGDEGSPILAQLAAPTGVSVDPWGNILIADCLNNRIRMISSNAVVHK